MLWITLFTRCANKFMRLFFIAAHGKILWSDHMQQGRPIIREYLFTNHRLKTYIKQQSKQSDDITAVKHRLNSGQPNKHFNMQLRCSQVAMIVINCSKLLQLNIHVIQRHQLNCSKTVMHKYVLYVGRWSATDTSETSLVTVNRTFMKFSFSSTMHKRIRLSRQLSLQFNYQQQIIKATPFLL